MMPIVDKWIKISNDYIAINRQEGIVGILKWMDVESYHNFKNASKSSDNVSQMLKQLNHKNRIHHVTSIFPNDIS